MSEFFCLQNGNKVTGNVVEQAVREIDPRDEIGIYLAGNFGAIPAPWHLLRIVCPERLADQVRRVLVRLMDENPDGVETIRWFFLSASEYRAVRQQ